MQSPDECIKKFSPTEPWYRNSVYLLPLLFMAVNLPLLWLNSMPVDDVAARYAPMAEAVAAGNWRWAFHPRFGMFFPLLSGSIVKLTGANGFRGCQIAALLLFTLSSYPLYGLAIKLFNRAIAI